MQSAVEAVTVQVDENGRILLPSFVREQMQLKPGTTLIVEAAENAELHLRVVPEPPSIVDKGGLMVIAGKPLENIEAALERDREDRIQSLLRDINP